MNSETKKTNILDSNTGRSEYSGYRGDTTEVGGYPGGQNRHRTGEIYRSHCAGD